MAANTTTLIRNLDWTIAWDEANGTHEYLRGADLAFSGDSIVHVGPGFAGRADAVVDGAGLIASPGFVNVHSHPSSEPGNKGVLEELGSPALGQSSLYEFMPVFRLDPGAAEAATQVAVWELLKSGVTTFCDLSGARDGWADQVAATGIRAVLCPMFRAATWAARAALPRRSKSSMPRCGIPRAGLAGWWDRRRSTPAARGFCARASPRRASAASRPSCMPASRSSSSTRSRAVTAGRRSSGSMPSACWAPT
jgi:hypothetical protein